jgi:diadenylate cyclase
MVEVLVKIWRPMVEILILTVAIYYVLIFVRGTRAWAIVTGFAVMIALYAGSRLLQLEVLEQILQNFFAASAFLAFVIFQPELRKMLGELGNLRLFNTTREQRENIEVIVEAAERLAESKIGALMAIQQNIILQEVVASGVEVDCATTPEMLEAIFFPNNPIHDGGVIIHDDRILLAACFFPLTQRQDLNKSLGTRHRAAIGLTEETDAVVVVVSEETGSLSYAYKGHLVRGISLEDLRAFLTSVFIRRGNRRKMAAQAAKPQTKPREATQATPRAEKP